MSKHLKRSAAFLTLIFMLVATMAHPICAYTESIAEEVPQTSTEQDNEVEVTANPDYTEPSDQSTVSDSDSITATNSTAISSGVYKIKNVYNGKYLDTRNGGISNGTQIQQWANEDSTRDQLFKITFLGTSNSANHYSIRPMTNSAMGLIMTSGRAELYTMQTSESMSIQTSQRWIISESGNYYTIKNALNISSSYMATPSNSTDGSMIIMSSTISNNSKWILEPYEGSAIDGITIQSRTSSLLVNEIFSYTACMYSSTIGRNGPIEYSVSEPDNSATDKATMNSFGTLVTLKPGVVRVKWTYDGAPYVWSILVTIDFEEDIVHTFRNVSQNKLMKPASVSSGAAAVVDTYSYTKETMMWKFEYDGNGYYRIKNDVTGYYLRAPANNTDGAAIIQASYLPTTYGLWRISRTSDGYYTLQSKNQYERDTTTKLYLAVSGNSIVQKSGSTSNKWEINPLVLKIRVMYDAAFITRYGSSALDKLEAIYGNNSAGNSFQSVFKDRFGIKVDVDIASLFNPYPYQCGCRYRNAVDLLCIDCKNADNKSDAIECQNGLHHKSETHMLSSIGDSTLLQNADETNILYTGQIGCYSDGVNHRQKSYYGWAYVGGNNIIIMTSLFKDDLDDNFINNILRTTVHEHMHCFGTGHCSSSQCIMNKNTPEINAALSMCTNCRDEIDENKLKLYNMSQRG